MGQYVSCILLFNFAIQYATKKAPQKNQELLELNGTLLFLIYEDDVKIVGKNLNSIKNTEALLEATKEIGLEVNTQKRSIVVSPSESMTKS